MDLCQAMPGSIQYTVCVLRQPCPRPQWLCVAVVHLNGMQGHCRGGVGVVTAGWGWGGHYRVGVGWSLQGWGWGWGGHYRVGVGWSLQGWGGHYRDEGGVVVTGWGWCGV